MQAKVTVRVSASTLGDLNEFVGRTFSIKRHGVEALVTLVEVKRDAVQLAYAKSERTDQFSVSQAKFRKFYKLLRTDKVDVPLEEI